MNAYQKEQIEYIQGLINKIGNFVEDKQSRIAWSTVKELSQRKSTSRDKLKADTQEERIYIWKDHI